MKIQRSLWGRRGRYLSLGFVLTIIPLSFIACRPAPPDYSGSTYLVIAPESLLESVTELVQFRQSQGLFVETVAIEEILASNRGKDGPEMVRNYLIDIHTENPAKEFVLLVGSMDTMPMRIAHTNPENPAGYDVPTDYYYQELTCDWDLDNDGIYGEWGDDMTLENCDYAVEAWVGRLPWDDPSEIEGIVDTIIAYEMDESPRMTTAISTAAIIAIACDAALFVDLAENTYMKTSGYTVTSLYEQCPRLNPDFELSRDDFLGQWEIREPGFVAWFSHGSSYGSSYRTSPYTFIDVENLPQNVRPAITITSGCTVGNSEVESLGRVLLREGVSAGFVGATRTTTPGLNPIPAFTTQYRMAKHLILERQTISAATANAFEYYVEHESPEVNISGPLFNKNIFEFIIYGDPALQAK